MRKHSRGFSMIEVLVTLLLLSIGILGMVALQTRTIQYTQDAAQRNTAAMLGNDLLELIRATPDSVAGFYKAEGADLPAVPSTGCVPLPTAASEQLACWAEKASTALPGADSLLKSHFHICKTDTANSCPPTPTGDAVEIQLAWKVRKGDCLDSEGNQTTATIDGVQQPICTYQVRSRI